MKKWEDFENTWVIDYEFFGKDGDPQQPICYVGQNLSTNEIIKHWIDGSETRPEYSIDDETLIIAYFASAEMGCHIPLKFKIPPYLLDLFVEFRCRTNGINIPSGRTLIGACICYNVPGSDATYKDIMRNRILQGPPYSKQEKKDILLYCQKDVEMTARLFSRMKKEIDLPYALLRGRYMAAVAQMEYNGVPIDMESLTELRNCWDILKEELIFRVDENYNVYEKGVFKIDKFRKYLKKHKISWDYTPTGLPKTDNDYMKNQAKFHPQLKPLQELRYSLGQLRLKDLQVGADGRNRCLLSPFASKTSRNQPSSSKFIFGNATWVRSLIKPQEGQAISYIDYEQQELAIAAVLSNDKNLIEAYNSGDPYLAFAKSAGTIPKTGTKETHPKEREIYKRCMLAINYGMSAETFAKNVQIPLIAAKTMIKAHKKRYHCYWEWSSSFVDIAKLSGEVRTRHNWLMKTINAKHRTLLNWPMQSHGADILRLAISMCLDNGVKVIAPVHDAILIEDSIENIDDSTKLAQECMEDASEYILNFKIRTEAKTIRYPDRYTDPRGISMWDTIWDIIHHINPEEKAARLLAKMTEETPLDYWEPSLTKLTSKLSKRRRGQLMVKPENFTEKILAQRLEKKSGLSHIEIMHLIRLARDVDYDLEHNIDWDNQDYKSIKKKIQGDINPTRRQSLKKLQGEVYQYE